MKVDYFFFYTEANIVCIVILAILLINDRLHSTKQEKQIWFNNTIIMHIIYFVSDICWAGVLSGQLPRTRLLVGLFNFTNYIMLNLLAFEWFMYMAAAENMPFRKSIRRRSMWRIPMTVSIAVMVIAYIAAPTFWINENCELNKWYYPLFIFTPVLYLAAAFVISMRNAWKTESREDRKLYRLIGIYPLGVVAFGLVQIFALDAPLFCFGCTIMMLFFYIENMQSLVSVDSLTRLNNRGQINRYMERTPYRENFRTAVMMIDIDRFKEINDTYGHAEGDRALVLVSEALKQAADRTGSSGFIGRYGGDEFTVFVQCAEDEPVPEQFVDEVRQILTEKQAQNKLPYDLKISVGSDSLKDRNDKLEACLVRADEKLYEDKKKRNIGR